MKYYSRSGMMYFIFDDGIPNMVASKEFSEGRKAWGDGLGKDSAPYEAYSGEDNRWYAGFNAALTADTHTADGVRHLFHNIHRWGVDDLGDDHALADDLLCHLLAALGETEVVDQYNKITRAFA